MSEDNGSDGNSSDGDGSDGDGSDGDGSDGDGSDGNSSDDSSDNHNESPSGFDSDIGKRPDPNCETCEGSGKHGVGTHYTMRITCTNHRCQGRGTYLAVRRYCCKKKERQGCEKCRGLGWYMYTKRCIKCWWMDRCGSTATGGLRLSWPLLTSDDTSVVR